MQDNKFDNDVTQMYKAVSLSGMPTTFIRNIGTQLAPKLTNVYADMNEFFSDGIDSVDIGAVHSQIGSWYPFFADVDNFLLLLYEMMRDEETEVEMTMEQFQTQVEILKDGAAANYLLQEASLQQTYENFIDEIDDQIRAELVDLDRILEVQGKLLRFDAGAAAVFVTEPEISTVMFSYEPLLRGKAPKLVDGLDIFNGIVTSQYIPYAKYIDDSGRAYHKVFQGIHQEEQPEFDKTIIDSAQDAKPNFIYLTLWLGHLMARDTSKTVKKSFYTVFYSLVGNQLKIESPSSVTENFARVAREQVADAFTEVDLGRGREERVRADLKIYDWNFDETVLMDFLTNDRVFYSSFFADESVTSYPRRDGFTLYYVPMFMGLKHEMLTITQQNYISNIASITFTLTRETVTDERTEKSIDGRVAKKDKNNVCYRLHIEQAASEQMIQQFLTNLRYLVAYYQQESPGIASLYARVIPSSLMLAAQNANRQQRAVVAPEAIKRTGRQGGEKIQALKTLAGDIFREDYSRFCQASFQPRIVDEQVAAMDPLKVARKLRKGKLLLFPTNGRQPPHYFACDGDKLVPILRENTIKNDAYVADYPCLPCCAAKGKKRSTNLACYQEGVPVEAKAEVSKAENVLKTLKPAGYGRLGVLPTAVEKIIQRYNEEGDSHMVRHGTLPGRNSFLHSVLYAVSDEYRKLQNLDAIAAMAEEERGKIVQKIHPGLLKQEMYDYSLEEIGKSLASDDLDSRFHYRALEEYYRINIFVFVKGEGEIGEIEIPRFRIFHAHPLRASRPTVVLMKLRDGKQVHYETILDMQGNVITRSYYPADTLMLTICYENLQKFLRTITWTTSEGPLKADGDIYSFLDPAAIFRGRATSQHIDENGKLRRITLTIGGEQLTVSILPCQPLNLPITDDITACRYQVAIETFGRPTRIAIDDRNEVDGLWYPMINMTEGAFVPINPVSRGLFDTTVGSPNPLREVSPSITQRMSLLKRSLNIMVRLIRWVFLIEMTSYGGANAKDFIDNYFTHAEYEGDSLQFYNFSKVKYALPALVSTNAALDYLESLGTGLVVQRKFVMYSAEFLGGIAEMLENFYNLTVDTRITIPTAITDFYHAEADFTQIPGTRIFVNDRDFRSWLNTVKTSSNFIGHFAIHETVRDQIGKTPYIYRDRKSGKIYLLQTVHSREEALVLALKWEKQQINWGSANERLPVLPSHVIFGVDAAGIIIPVEDHRQPNSSYLSILRHSNKYKHAAGSYAAMLELL